MSMVTTRTRGLPLYRYIPREGKRPNTRANPIVSPGGWVTITSGYHELAGCLDAAKVQLAQLRMSPNPWLGAYLGEHCADMPWAVMAALIVLAFRADGRSLCWCSAAIRNWTTRRQEHLAMRA